MTSSSNLPARLIATAGAGGGRRGGGGDEPDDFIRKMLYHPDAKEAAQIVAEQAALEWDMQYGAELEAVRMECEELQTRYEQSCKLGEALDHKDASTDSYTKVARGKSETNSAVPFREWFPMDQVTVTLAGVFAVIALFMGAAGVQANLEASGNPVFIEQPFTKWLLSALLPAASVALKFVSNFLPHDRARRNYGLAVYIITGVLLLFWMVLFAINFTGISGGIDWSDMGEADHGGSLLVFVQLAAEAMVGTALFLVIDLTASKYAAGYSYLESLEKIQIRESRKTYSGSHTPLSAAIKAARGQKLKLEASRQSTINSKVATFTKLRARFDAMKSSDFNF